MEIRLAKKNNLLEVLYIVRECSRQLLEKGVKYWNNSLADYNEIDEDIEDGFVYLIIVNSVAVGTATIKPDKSDPKITLLSRLAIYPPFQKRGLAQSMIDFAEKQARNNNSKILKGYTPLDDKPLTQLLEEKGFCNKGIENEIPIEFGRICFEKSL